jgi:hypothetical protein
MLMLNSARIALKLKKQLKKHQICGHNGNIRALAKIETFTAAPTMIFKSKALVFNFFSRVSRVFDLTEKISAKSKIMRRVANAMRRNLLKQQARIHYLAKLLERETTDYLKELKASKTSASKKLIKHIKATSPEVV